MSTSTSNGDWYAPEGFGPVLIPYLDYQLLMAVDVVDGEYELAHTATESDTQDFCIETLVRTARRPWMRAK